MSKGKEKKALREIIRDKAYYIIKDASNLSGKEVVTKLPFLSYDENDKFFESVSRESYYSFLDSMYYLEKFVKISAKGEYSNKHDKTILSLFALHVNKEIKQLIYDNMHKIRYVTNGEIWPFFSVKVFISERTESISVIVPNRKDDPFFSDKTDYEILEWAFENIQFVPIMVRDEEFEPNKVSHKWSHLRKNKDILLKLKKYLEIADYKPNYNVYYYIKHIERKGQHIWYLKRDVNMSPNTIEY